MRTLALLISAAFLLMLFSCTEDDVNVLGGDPSPIGAVTNNFSFGWVDGATDIQANITDLTDGVSTIDYSVMLQDSTLLAWAAMMSGVNLNGDLLEATRKYRITTDGIQSVYDDGSELMLVKYNAKVGDEYTLDRGLTTWKREVTRKSTDDDYSWGFLDIKTIDVKTNEFSFPGVSHFQYYFNHRFGLVGVRAFFEDGTSDGFNVYSDATN